MPELEPVEVQVRLVRGALKALAIIGEDLLGKAVDLAPIEEGTLRGSGAIAFVVNDRRFEAEGALAVAIAYATSLVRAGVTVHVDVEVLFNTIYAARQHEELEWIHPLGGQAKFLEQPLREDAARYPAVIAAAQRRELAA